MSFRYVITDDHTEQPAVYKLFFGNKFYIWKGKSLSASVETICRDISRFAVKGYPPDHLLKKVMDYYTRYRPLFCRVEVLIQTDNVTQLIDFENLTLTKFKDDPDCLNIKFEAHVPKWITEPGQPVEKPMALNKPIRETFKQTDVPKVNQVVNNKPIAKENGVHHSNKLMDALAKLNK